MSFHRARPAGALVVVVVLAASAGFALAAQPKKGYVYETNNQTTKVSVYFKVSGNGRRVTGLLAGTPIKCPASVGGVGGLPYDKKPGSATIKHGTFKATLTLYAPGAANKKEGTDTVTGAFRANGTATGTVADHFNNNSGVCKATSRRYTAQGYRPTG